MILDKNFILGAATSAYQIEGAYNEDGKGESIWDRFCKESGTIPNGETGNTACNHYHLFREDVGIMAEMGLDSYRFSVAWSRVLPKGVGEVNEKGLEFYVSLVDELLAHGIKPNLTLYHWDLPQALQDRGGWLNEESIEWFCQYAELIFRTFGSKVDMYVTFNEPFVFTHFGYATGSFAPAIKDEKSKLIAAHNVLRAHGRAVQLFRRLNINSKIGIVLDYAPNLPNTSAERDVFAAEKTNEFWAGWFYEPIALGHYPRRAREWFEKNGMLPKITEDDERLIAESIDFLGINYYFANYVEYSEDDERGNARLVSRTYKKNSMGWDITEDGFSELLKYFKKTLKIPLFITENGIPLKDVFNESGEINDTDRIDYIEKHLSRVASARENGQDIRGYYYWSLMDNFEWASGYAPRFGLIHVDYKTQKRTLKQSAHYYKNLIAQKNNGKL